MIVPFKTAARVVITVAAMLALRPAIAPAQGPGGPPPFPPRGPRPGPPGGGPPGAGGEPGATIALPRTPQNLWIPPALTGKVFNLTFGKSTRSFSPGVTTNTYSCNDTGFWGPTLILNQGDAVQLSVKNNLDEVTTVHWHGMHLPAAMDGGPHQIIQPGGAWTSSFVVKNNAATYWYHPHPHELTQKQLTLGVGGLIIVRDPIEGRLALPRTYGVDDIPLVLTSRRFYADGQFSYQGDRDKYGDYLLVNGTLDAQVNLPAQFVRLRILNAEIERGYNLGFSDHRTFYVIATDGGLVDKPIPVTRLKLMVGERVELLVDLSGDRPGSSVDLLSFNANQPFGFPGGEPGRGRPNGGFLNNLDFRVLHLNVTAPTASRITKLPEVLTRNRFWTEADVTNRRSLRISGGGPPAREFSFDGKYFDMKFTNSVVKLGATEAWTIANDRIFGHSFHIHDIQFKIVSRSDGPVADYEQGWKDTLYLPRGASATFITRFDDYASDTDPFMYHCHMANHEDGGLMGQFLVSRDPAAIKSDGLGMIRLRDCFQYPLTASLVTAAAQLVQTKAPVFQAEDLAGRPVGVGASQDKPLVLFFIDQNCPCARSATPYLIALQNAYGASFVLVGITNGNTEAAQEWAKSTGANFPIIADPGLAISTAYHAERAASTVVVAPGGRISRAWPGFSAPMLRELGKSVAALAGVPERSLSVEGAPVDYVIGCPLFPSELEPVTSTQIVPAASITAANRYAR